MSREEAKLVRESILATIEDYARLRDLVKELGVDTSFLGPGRRSREDYRFAIEIALGGDFGRVLDALSSDELQDAHRRVFQRTQRGRQSCVDALLPRACGTIDCFIAGNRHADTPEERVRQRVARWLYEHRGYSKEDMSCEFEVQTYSDRPRRVDLAIFPRTTRGIERRQTNIYLIVECKRDNISDKKKKEARVQLESYLSAATNARYGVLVIGDRVTILRKIKEKAQGVYGDYEFREERDVPHAADDAPPLTVVVGADRGGADRPAAPGAGLQAPIPSPEVQWAAAWAQLTREPWHFLDAVARSYDDSWIRGTRQLADVVIANKSPFPVQDVSGEVTWVEASGVIVGTVPFVTVGAVPPGHRAVFSLAAGTLRSTPLVTRAQHAVLRCLRLASVASR